MKFVRDPYLMAMTGTSLVSALTQTAPETSLKTSNLPQVEIDNKTMIPYIQYSKNKI